MGVSDIVSRRGELWVTVAKSHEVMKVRAKTGNLIGDPIPMVDEPRAIDAGEGAIWVAEQSPRGSTTSARPTARSGCSAGANPTSSR
jgi:hypothetical protein